MKWQITIFIRLKLLEFGRLNYHKCYLFVLLVLILKFAVLELGLTYNYNNNNNIKKLITNLI